MRKILILFLAVLVSACSASQPKSELEQAQEKWQEAGISHYRFHLNIGCFCVFSQDMPLLIEVQDGEVVSMAYQSGKAIETTNMELFQHYNTIDRIFAELEKDLGGEADKVTVTYDETYGYPSQVSIDFIEQAVDDELGLTVTNFEELP